jgi:ergothioneine biosynthesis protein EgtB
MLAKNELIKYFRRVRNVSEEICQPLMIEDYVVQPIEDVSPPKWHLGHTSWFYEAMFLDRYVKNYKPFHPKYFFLFNSYYQSLGDRWERPKRGVLSRPTVKNVYEYRQAITERMIELTEKIKENKWKEYSELLVLALNHEQQHQELLLTDIKYILAMNPLFPVYQPSKQPAPNDTGLESEFIEFDGGVYEIGFKGNGFCYDNEQPQHKTYVDAFKLQNRLVTNAEYLKFMESGGYDEFRFWLSDGWDAVQKNGWQAPLHWGKIDGEWHEMTLNGLRKIVPDAPVCHVSYFEAEAYASWANKRLPSEAEWEIAARESGVKPEQGNFYDDKIYHLLPVDPSRQDNGKGIYQMLGDVWEWTGSGYLPYPGYKQAEGALGEYNGKFMVNQMVLRGGSCATSRNHARITYRNFFQPDKRWQFTGIRLADDIK